MSTRFRSSLADYFCDRCGDFLPDDIGRHIVNIQILSEVEGVVIADGNGPMTDDLAAELGEEIYQEDSFILCGSCKEQFALDPFNRGTGHSSRPKRINRLSH